MKAAIVGVNGYTGIELIRLILQHPYLTLGTLHGRNLYKKSISDYFPHLATIESQPITEFDAKIIMQENDLVFFATPSGISKDLVQPFVDEKFPVIDLSGDLRLTQGDYRTWYKKEPASQEVLEQALYGLPEFTNVTGHLVSNPGCYATAALLALVPLVKKGLIDLDSIILDGKSGLSGAGKSLSNTSHFVSVEENMSMYKLNQHQHIPEILQFLKGIDSTVSTIQFTTSLIPVKRGIFMTLYAKIKSGVSVEQVQQAFQEIYQNKPFVRVQLANSLPELRQVQGTNFCDIGFGLNEENRMLTVVSVIDNLMKGAAGQAIQNANLLMGFDETCGLQQIAPFP